MYIFCIILPSKIDKTKGEKMIEKKIKSWFQLIGSTITQHRSIINKEVQLDNAFENICLRLDEDDLCCEGTDEESIKQSLAKHQICQIPVHHVDILGPLSLINTTYYCPFYDKEKECPLITCEHHVANQNYFELRKQFKNAKSIQKNNIRQIFGLRTK